MTTNTIKLMLQAVAIGLTLSAGIAIAHADEAICTTDTECYEHCIATCVTDTECEVCE